LLSGTQLFYIPEIVKVCWILY